MEKVPETTYFRRVKPLWFAVIAVSMGYFAVLACLAGPYFRILIRLGPVQAERHHERPGSPFLVRTNLPLRDSVSLPLDCLPTRSPETEVKLRRRRLTRAFPYIRGNVIPSKNL
ncbi:transmembrane protein 254 isoform X3 [Tachyglossus aculeatus]|uniref:transmembrane protein 254 isoform X3 n=1 Tax=Tachyglossus aculeatus TaxID=9261 RepID=UPI0018F5CEDD|nr:transmembrane protein 254 isoform X3 [Tachyglossus aculeatus]